MFHVTHYVAPVRRVTVGGGCGPVATCVQKEGMRLLVVPQSSIELYRRQGEEKALPSELKVRLTLACVPCPQYLSVTDASPCTTGVRE